MELNNNQFENLNNLNALDFQKKLHTLFVDGIKDIYGAEIALTKALPIMIAQVSSDSLKNALEEHLDITKLQVQRLEDLFDVLDEVAESKQCPAMEGLIKEGNEIMEDNEKGPIKDLGIIAAGQKIEHYEIASYGTLAAIATKLGEQEAANLLLATLEEEKEADSILTEITENIFA